MDAALSPKEESMAIAAYFKGKILHESPEVQGRLMQHLWMCPICRKIARRALGLLHR